MYYPYNTTSTYNGAQPKSANQRENKVKLYKVYMDVRYGKANSEGVYEGGISSGYFHVQAASEKSAKEKARKGIDAGIEPFMVSTGGHCIPSPNKMTITMVCLESGPYIP